MTLHSPKMDNPLSTHSHSTQKSLPTSTALMKPHESYKQNRRNQGHRYPANPNPLNLLPICPVEHEHVVCPFNTATIYGTVAKAGIEDIPEL